ncbi:hypothetical protein GF312_01040 [Candidatus Poribacteria bacterium]|nr:hypothetical protein [Candidatus Poribacteria bacterium]
MELIFRMHTPLWTGDAKGQSNKAIKETGVLGSLRWWYGVVVRGLQRSCINMGDGVNFSHSQALFGGSGQNNIGRSRRFRLTTSGGTPCYTNNTDPVRIKPSRGSARHNGWFLGCGLTGNIKARFDSFYPDFDPAPQLSPIIAMSSHYGGLGARTQHGYGIFSALGSDGETPLNFPDRTQTVDTFIQNIQGQPEVEVFPALQDFFFAKFTFQTEEGWEKDVDGLWSHAGSKKSIEGWLKSSVPVSPALKNQLRFVNIFTPPSITRIRQGAESYIFGDSDKKIASKINISCAYEISENVWEIRVWGWIPDDNIRDDLRPRGLSRNTVLAELYTSLDNPNLWTQALGTGVSKTNTIWREFDSGRDNVLGTCTDIRQFFASLLN